MPRKLKNIRPWKGGWQAYTEIHGRTKSKSFPRSTTVPKMRAWIKKLRDKHRPAKVTEGTFGYEVADYLTRVSAMTSYAQRAAHLALWVQALGPERPRETITTAEIDRVIQRWIVAGLAPRTIRKRRMSFMSMWNTVDGKDAPNPIRLSQCPREPKDEARSLDYETIQQLFDLMAPSSSKTRLLVMAWTGLPPGMIGKIERADLNLTAKTLRVSPRRKGAGVEARTLPLLPQGVEVMQQFDREKLYGPFNPHSLNALFHRACKKHTPPIEGFRAYDLRHSFLTMLYKVTGDIATVARFALHANVAMSQRYTMGANFDVDRAAADSAGIYLSPKPVPENNTSTDNDLHD